MWPQSSVCYSTLHQYELQHEVTYITLIQLLIDFQLQKNAWLLENTIIGHDIEAYFDQISTHIKYAIFSIYRMYQQMNTWAERE